MDSPSGEEILYAITEPMQVEDTELYGIFKLNGQPCKQVIHRGYLLLPLRRPEYRKLLIHLPPSFLAAVVDDVNNFHLIPIPVLVCAAGRRRAAIRWPAPPR